VDVAAFLESINRRNVRMVERGEQSRLTLEPRAAIRVPDERFGQDLDGDIATELHVARPVDVAHPAGAKQRADFVRSQTLPDQCPDWFVWFDGRRHRLQRRRPEEIGRLVRRRDQRFHLEPQRLIAKAGVAQKCRAVALVARQRLVAQLFDVLPSLGRRHGFGVEFGIILPPGCTATKQRPFYN
jgi:hypothetical protein